MSKVRKLADFRPAIRRRIHEDVAQQLRDAILDGRFPAGSKLPPERELALEFQVNRTSIRDAIKVLEGLNLIRVRQGDGATVLPIVEASIDLLPAIIFHGGRVDLQMILEMADVVRPMLFEMARVGLERGTQQHIEAIRALNDRVRDIKRDEDSRDAALRDLLVVLSDMSGNRVWQMLTRRLRALLASEPMRQTRKRIYKDHARLAELIDFCLENHAAGRKDETLVALRRCIDFAHDELEVHESSKPRAQASRQ